MRSSWIKRWHRRDEPGHDNGNTAEASSVREECLIDAGQENNLYLCSLEEKEVGEKVVSNGNSCVEADNPGIHTSDSLIHSGHKNKERFSHDLQEKNIVNAISRHRVNPALGETSNKQEEEERRKPQEEPIKLVSGKPPPPPPRNKSGLPPKSVNRQIAFVEKFSRDFPVTDLQLNIASQSNQYPVPRQSTIKSINVGMEKEILEPGSSHISKIDDISSSIACFPWEIFPEAGGPSKSVKEHITGMSQVANKVSTKEIEGSLKLTLQTGHIAADHVQEVSQSFQLHKKSAENMFWTDNINLARGKQCNLREDAPKQVNLPLRYNNDLSLCMEQQEVLNSRNENLGQRQCEQASGDVYQLPYEKINMEGNEDDLDIHNQKLKGKAKVDPTSGESSQVVVFHEKSSHKQEVASLLGKCPHTNAKDNVLSLKREKEMNMKTLCTSHIWIQRWHPNTTDNDTKNLMSDASVFSVRNNLTSSTSISTYSPLGMKKFKDSDGYGLFSRSSREMKSKMIDVKGQLIECSNSIHSKTLPSPAAMAIVGTAARQFCSSQPYRRGSFAFWSGFGMPSPQKIELRKKS